MSIEMLNNPTVCAGLNPQFGSVGGSTVTITPPNGSGLQSANLVMNTGNSLGQYYQLYASRGAGGGLMDGCLQLYSYNLSSDPIVELIQITPQNSTSDALIDVTANVIVSGSCDVGSLNLDGVSSGANFSLSPASGSDATIRLNGPTGVGYPYDSRYNLPPAGRTPLEVIDTAWAGVGTYAFATELTTVGSGNYLGDLCIIWHNGTAANAATDKVSVSVVEVGGGSTQIDLIDIPVPTLGVAEASRVSHYQFYSVNAYDATKTHNLTVGVQGTPTIAAGTSVVLTMQRLA